MSSSPQDRGDASGAAPSAPQDPPGASAAPPAPPATPPDGASESGRRSNGRLGEWAALISAVAAVAGVALGFLGLPALIKSPTARTETVYVTVTPTTAPALAVPTPSSAVSPGTSGAPSTSSSPTAFNGSVLTFPPGEDYGFRLRGPNPTLERYSKGLDFYRQHDDINAMNDSRIIALKPEEPGTLTTCTSVTRFVTVLVVEELEAGMRFCFESGKGAIALVEVPENGELSDFLDLTVQYLGNR